MKKIYVLILLSMLFVGKVNADEIYYKNENNVVLTKHEYNTISEFYWEGYQETLSIEDFYFLKENGLFENKVNSVEINDNPISLYSVEEHTTANKSLKMSISCSSNCVVAISLKWINLPKIRSYDILGIYLDNTRVIQETKLRIDTNRGKTEYSYDKKETNGIGTSFKLPTDVTYLNVAKTLVVEKRVQ